MAEFSNIPSFFDGFSQAVAEDLMAQQLAPNQPEPAKGIFTTSDAIIPDRNVADRLSHLDPDLYDLREQSHLMKLFRVLLGGAGLGGLRKQAAVARLQNTFAGMHFLDLDRFYGVLFGVRRGISEVYPDQNFDPYTQATDSSTWDTIHARDARYRSRLANFARAIPLGGTYLGIKAMAEALLGVECEIYESWALLDAANLPVGIAPTGLIYTFSLIESVAGTWGNLDGQSWFAWGGGNITQVGRSNLNTRSDFVLQPKRELTTAEQYQLTRVIDQFKPSGTQFIIDPHGVALRMPIAPRVIAADSEYWEVTSRVLPKRTIVIPTAGLYQADRTQPRPAFSQYQSEEWTYNGEITSVTSYAQHEDTQLARGNDELVAFGDGSSHYYRVDDAVMTPAQAMSSRLVGDGVLTSAAYSRARGNAASVEVSA